MQLLKGAKQEVIKESVDYLKERQIEYLIAQGIKYPEPILTFNDHHYIFPYTINLIQGGFGANKSFFAAHMAATFLSGSMRLTSLNMVVAPKFDYMVVYIDTERSIRDHLPAAMGQMIRIAGYPEKFKPKNLRTISLKNVPRLNRLETIKTFLNRIKYAGKHIILILDVITDCMKSFNDLGETNSLLDELNTLIENEEITVVAVIHENPDGTKKARGHIGTEIVNKSTTAVSINLRNESDIIIVKTIKNRLARMPKEMYIKRLENSESLVFADALEIDQLNSKKNIKLTDLAEFLIEKLNGHESSTVDLITIIGEKFDSSSKTTRTAINQLFDNQTYLNQNGFGLKKRKGEKNSNWYSLKKLDSILIPASDDIPCLVNSDNQTADCKNIGSY